MKLVRHLNQGSPEWKAWRRGRCLDGKRVGGGIGGSDVAAVLGVSPYDDHTRDTVFREKTSDWERESNYAMHRGQRLEPSARLAYTERTRSKAVPVCVEMDGCDWARVSLDGLCEPDEGAAFVESLRTMPAAARERALRSRSTAPAAGDADRWILELKCPSWEVHDAALQGVVPEHFAVQIQWQLLVTGLDRCDFASFNPHRRFTPDAFPLAAKWDALPAGTRESPKPTLLDLWLALRPADRPPMPDEWLAVHELRADPERQAWIMEEAGRFWFGVLEAREALANPGRAGGVL